MTVDSCTVTLERLIYKSVYKRNGMMQTFKFLKATRKFDSQITIFAVFIQSDPASFTSSFYLFGRGSVKKGLN